MPHVRAPGSHIDAVSLDAYVQGVKAAATHAVRREIEHVARAKVVQHTAERRAKIVPGGDRQHDAAGVLRQLVVQTGRRSLAPRAASGHKRSRDAGAWATRGRRQWWVRDHSSAAGRSGLGARCPVARRTVRRTGRRSPVHELGGQDTMTPPIDGHRELFRAQAADWPPVSIDHLHVDSDHVDRRTQDRRPLLSSVLGRRIQSRSGNQRCPLQDESHTDRQSSPIHWDGPLDEATICIGVLSAIERTAKKLHIWRTHAIATGSIR